MNGAMLYWPVRALGSASRGSIGFGTQYVEGYSLDEFAAGRLDLLPKCKGGHRIGLLLDKAMEPELRTRHLQVADAARATLGINVAACVITATNVNVSLSISPSGASWGSIDEDGEFALLQGARKLLDLGCTAIAGTLIFQHSI